MKVRDTIFNCSVEDVISELRSELSLNGSSYLQKEPKRSGKSIQVQCPFHGDGMEHKPSGGITTAPLKKGNRIVEEGTFHCFACGKVCDLPEFISFCIGEPDELGKAGWKWLCKNFLSVSVENRPDIELDFGRGRRPKKEKKYVTEEDLDAYRYYHVYWGKRGIKDERLIELFDLGYDKKSRCITFPVRDVQGRTLFVARRSVDTKYFNYPSGAEKPLYGLYEYMQCVQESVDRVRAGGRGNGKTECLRRLNTVIVCESMLDALTCWQYGSYAVALNGLGNERQFKQLRELPCRELVLATDNDEAGMKARKRIREQVKNKLITEYILPPGKKDMNELTKEEFDNLEKVF